MIIVCPNCGRKLRVRDSCTRRRGKCPVCKLAFDIPPKISESMEKDSGQELVVHIDPASSYVEQNPTNDSLTDKGTPSTMVDQQTSVTTRSPQVKEAEQTEIMLTCPCGHSITVTSNLIGQEYKCAACGKILTIPPPLPPQLNAESQIPPPIFDNQNDRIAQVDNERHDDQVVKANQIKQSNILNSHKTQVEMPSERPTPVSHPDMKLKASSSIAPRNERDSFQPEFTKADVPILIPVLSNRGKSAGSTKSRSSKFEKVCHKWAGRIVAWVMRTSPIQLWLVRLIMAVALVFLLCLLEFSQRMGWSIATKGFTLLFALTGIGTNVIGALAKSLTDVLLGIVAVVSIISTPLIAGMIISNNPFGRPNPIFTAPIAFAGLGQVLIAALAVVSILSICAALSREGSKINDKSTMS